MNVLALLLTGYVLFGQPFAPPVRRGGEIDKTDLRICCEKIKKEGPRITFLSDHNGKVKLRVGGVFVHGSVLLFLLQLNNRSSVDYAVDGVRFLLAGNDRNRAARLTALEPLFIYDSTTM